jgi:hypothetical protein
MEIKTQGRKEWAVILREAKAMLKVPQSQSKKKNNFHFVPSWYSFNFPQIPLAAFCVLFHRH